MKVLSIRRRTCLIRQLRLWLPYSFLGAPQSFGRMTIDRSMVQPPVAIVSNDRTAVNQAAKPFTTEEEPLLAPSQRDGTTGRTTAWVRLTEPGGKPIHINVEHVTSVRADTQIPGARAQLDLTSGKFQGVQEDIEQVMQLISTPGACANEEAPSAALKLSSSSLPKTSTNGPR